MAQITGIFNDDRLLRAECLQPAEAKRLAETGGARMIVFAWLWSGLIAFFAVQGALN